MRLSILLFLVFLAPSLLPADDPVFPYGAVYFRKSNPPEQDWERDHKTAAKVGMNIFRHWFLWTAIEVAPGKYDWRDYDRMLDLEAQNGIHTIIAEHLTAAPEWVYEKYPHALFKASDGTVMHSRVSAGSATGGWSGLCLDNEDVKALAEKFLTALVERYRNHPATYGYDLLNEGHMMGGSAQKMYCFCEATQKKYREWLKAKYGTLEALSRAWYRYSYPDWDYIHPPQSFGGYPESLDWLDFRIEDHFRLTRWRSELFRRLDNKHKITAHGVAKTLSGLPSSAYDDWRAAKEYDSWGFTHVASDEGNEPWKLFHAVDLVRAGSRGKPFWHAEAQAGPDWLHSEPLHLTRENGRVADEKDVRVWNLTSCAGGATGILIVRWRPLLDGPLFGAYGAFGMDGSITPRAEMAGKVARWANANPDVWKSRPIRGEVGIVFVPESEIFNYIQRGSTQFYAESARGAYQAFFDSNIQADFVHLDHIQEYPVVYLPYPVMLKEATARRLTDYVERGGILVSEGTPGYFGERGKVGTVQPNLGLDKLFGARESYVEFTPDLLTNLKLRVWGHNIDGGLFLQQYSPAGGAAAGYYANGERAAVENRYGKGKTLLIGTFPGAGYYSHHSPQTKAFFAHILTWGGVEQNVRSDDPNLKARLHTGAGGTYLWVVNPTRQPRVARISMLPKFGKFGSARDLWQEQKHTVAGQEIQVTVADRDVAVIRLQ